MRIVIGTERLMNKVNKRKNAVLSKGYAPILSSTVQLSSSEEYEVYRL